MKLRDLLVLGVVGLLLAGAFLLGASTARAIPFTGTLTLDINNGLLASLEGGGEAVSTPSSVQITSGGVLGTVTFPVTGTTSGGMVTLVAFPVVEIALTGPAGLGTASFSTGNGPSGGLGGTAPLRGTAKLGLFGPPPFAFLDVPLSPIGSPGASTMASSPLGIQVSGFGEGWTTGIARVIGTPFTGTGPVTLAQATGTDMRTPDGLGTVVLVSPTLVKTNLAGLEQIPLITSLELEIGEPGMMPGDRMDDDMMTDDVPDDPGPNDAVPEPGAALLFGAGVLLVARRLRRDA